MDNVELAAKLDYLADAIEREATTVIGSKVSVSVGPGFSGSVIGEVISVSAGAGATGNIIGKKVSVSVGGPIQVPPVVGELRAAAAEIRAGKKPQGWLEKVLARAAAFGGEVAPNLAGNLLSSLVTG